MIKRSAITLLAVLLSLSFLPSKSFSREVIQPLLTDRWKEDILILLKVVQTPGDYEDLVDLIEVAPSLKEDPKIRRAYVAFAPKGMNPPEWAREKKKAPLAITEVPREIITAKAQKEEERREIEEQIGVKPTLLPEGVKVIHSTDVVSGVKTEMVGEQMRVTITLSGERKYTVSERTRPPSIIINIPHTISAVFPKRIMVNRGRVRKIEVTQYRPTPFDETRIIVILNRETEYRITHKDNEIYIDFEE